MKKILLTGINARFSHSNPALYYLRTYVKDPGFRIVIQEYTINQDKKEILKSIIGQNPDIICISVYIWNVELVKEILPDINEALPKTEIVLGGPEVSYDPENWLKTFSFICHVITGHGEEGLKQFLAGNTGEQVISVLNPHFSTIPFPYMEEDFIRLKNRNIYYESSRGCPFRCSYCVSSHSGQKLQFRSVEQVTGELDIIVSHRPKIVKFVDRTFNAKRSHYMAIWEHAVKSYSGSTTKFHFELYPELLDEEDFKFLQQVPPGLFQFEVGIQSVHSETLRSINRKEKWEDIKPKVERLIRLENIHTHVDLIIGLPFEDYGKMKMSFNQAYSLKADHFQLGILKILKGTEIMKKASEYNIDFSPRAPYRLISTKWLNETEVKKLINISLLIDTIYCTHGFETTLENLELQFETPFHLYENLAEYIYSEYGSMRSGKWEENAERIAGFAEVKFPGKKNYFRDCLMYDWCRTTGLNYYPAMFRDEKTKKTKKDGFRFFTENWKGDLINHDGIEFSRSEMKRSIFFRPESEEFQLKYMKDFDTALFLKHTGRCILFNSELKPG